MEGLRVKWFRKKIRDRGENSYDTGNKEEICFYRVGDKWWHDIR
jgi:hypothetical protein